MSAHGVATSVLVASLITGVRDSLADVLQALDECHSHRRQSHRRAHQLDPAGDILASTSTRQRRDKLDSTVDWKHQIVNSYPSASDLPPAQLSWASAACGTVAVFDDARTVLLNLSL